MKWLISVQYRSQQYSLLSHSDGYLSLKGLSELPRNTTNVSKHIVSQIWEKKKQGLWNANATNLLCKSTEDQELSYCENLEMEELSGRGVGGVIIAGI